MFRESISEDRMCDIIEGYVYASRSTQEKVRQISCACSCRIGCEAIDELRTDEEDEDIIICILREGDLGETTLSDVEDWREAFVESGLTTDDAFNENGRRKRLNNDARKYLQLKGLLRCVVCA
jgi:hypothetical protein